MSGVNKVILIGNLGKEPEMRSFQNHERVANFSVATSNSWKDKATGEKKDAVEWHNVAAFGRRAEICAEYLHKGSKVYIEGHLKTEKYTDKDGIVRYATKVIVDNLQMLDSKGDGSTVREEEHAHSEQPIDPKSFDDDIPF